MVTIGFNFTLNDPHSALNHTLLSLILAPFHVGRGGGSTDGSVISYGGASFPFSFSDITLESAGGVKVLLNGVGCGFTFIKWRFSGQTNANTKILVGVYCIACDAFKIGDA